MGDCWLLHQRFKKSGLTDALSILGFLLLSYSGFSQHLVSETNLTNNVGSDRYGKYSLSGEHILFESDRDGDWEIYRMHADGSNLEKLTDNTNTDRRPCWHPTENKILFESDRSGEMELYELNLANGFTRGIEINLEGTPVFANYSPEGKKLIFSLQTQENASMIYSYDTEHRLFEKLVDFGFRSFYPSFVQENQVLFFSRHQTANEDDEIYLLDLITKEMSRLTTDPKHNFCPVISDDGDWLAYARSMEGSRPEIFLMDLKTREVMQLTFNDLGETLPDWHPSGKKLLVSAWRNDNYELVELLISN